MILKYYLKDNKKVYTLKGSNENKETIPAHYKFVKLKDVKEDYNNR